MHAHIYERHGVFLIVRFCVTTVYEWNAMVCGPPDTPYQHGIFRFIIKFTNDYPMEPVKVSCTQSPYH